MTICLETENHRRGIEIVHRAAFTSQWEALLVNLLRERGHLSISVLAEEDGDVVGHAAFSPAHIEPGDLPGLGLGPVAVISAYRRRGIAARLIEAGLAHAKAWHFCAVLGDPRYYRRFGFVPASSFGIHSDYPAGNAFQVLPIQGTLPPGRVRYAPEFAEMGI